VLDKHNAVRSDVDPRSKTVCILVLRLDSPAAMRELTSASSWGRRHEDQADDEQRRQYNAGHPHLRPRTETPATRPPNI